jgi:photosystem II S4 domain protein
MIDLKEILLNSNYKKETEELINIANLAYKHWETYWTGFNSTYVCEEILKDFENLNDFKFFIYGGFSSSQRSRIACFRGDNIPEEDALKSNFPAQGIKINGNFLFDNATQDDFRSLLIENGVNQIKVGDIWTIGDRGAQGIIDNLDIKHLDEKIFYLRDVKVKVNVVGIDELQIPSGRSKKLVNTVEASTRLDAIASAGFRVSRTKIIERIENGMLRLNGSKVNKPTINLKIGDKLELENKGFIEILNLEITKRERWKVKLLRK